VTYEDRESGHFTGQDGPISLGVCRCVAERPKAILVEFVRGGEDRWIPQSVIHADSEVAKKGQAGKLIVLEWWAEKNDTRGDGRPHRLPLPMKPPSKEWVTAQAERRERAKRG
jgi:hypothetical protein